METENKDTTVVVCNNQAELSYMCELSVMQGKLPPWSGIRETFPICVCLGGGWTDSMDRALTYIPFKKFIAESE